jgi:hypothetical protein
VEFGPDHGRNLGTLFEARDRQGRLVSAAGFLGLYNTRFRMDRHSLQFFVRDPDAAADFRFERLPRPDDDCGLYMFDHGGRLLAINESTGQFFREWDPARGAWRRATGAVAPLASTNDGVCAVGTGLLRFRQGQVEWNGQVILERAARGSYHHFYYAGGRLYFYHTVRTASGGFSRLHSCAWTPEAGGTIDPLAGHLLPVAPAGVVTWAWGQLGDQVLTVSNYGGVYVHGPRGWRVLRDPSPGVSYQVYSVLSHGDRLLLGQYPTGELFSFDGTRLDRVPGSPPRLASVSGSARECQTLGLYGGELLAGVWPWAEVWSREPDAGAWRSAGRLFTHPEPSTRTTHPYESECIQRGLVLNDWGQRVTSMVTVGNSLYLSTSAKGNHRWDAKLDFLSDTQRKEYGAVLRLRAPGRLAVPIRWRESAIGLTFEAADGRLRVLQDGRKLAETELTEGQARALEGATLTWGKGLFGEFAGRADAKDERRRTKAERGPHQSDVTDDADHPTEAKDERRTPMRRTRDEGRRARTAPTRAGGFCAVQHGVSNAVAIACPAWTARTAPAC